MLLGAKLIIVHPWKKTFVCMHLYRQKVSWNIINEQIASVVNDTIKRFHPLGGSFYPPSLGFSLFLFSFPPLFPFLSLLPFPWPW